MKKTYSKISPVIYSMIFLALTCLGCQKEDVPGTPSMVSIYGITIDDNVNFGFLKSAINRAGLREKLAGPGAFQFFAPTNDAFIAAGYKDTSAIRNADPAVLANILNYHLTTASINLDTIHTGYTEIAAENEGRLILGRNEKGQLSINGADINRYNFKTTNGLFHVVNRLLIPPAGNIEQTVATNPNLSFLAAAITRSSTGSTNIAQLLAGPSITFFAPTNAAFTSAGYASVAAIEAADPDVLAGILLYHILEGRRFSTDFKDTTITTMKESPVFLARPATGTSLVNGLGLTGINANVIASNGVIHIISKVLVSPSKNIVETVSGTSSLSLLKAAIARASQSDNNISALLSGSTVYTLLAPNDAAFKAAGYANSAAVNNADPSVLASMLMYHIIKGRRFSLTFTSDVSSVQTLSGASLTISMVSGLKAGGPGNSTLATGSPIDVLATNGVLHIVNQTMKP